MAVVDDLEAVQLGLHGPGDGGPIDGQGAEIKRLIQAGHGLGAAHRHPALACRGAGVGVVLGVVGGRTAPGHQHGGL